MKPVRCNMQAAYYRRGNQLPGMPLAADALPGLRSGPGGGYACVPTPNTELCCYWSPFGDPPPPPPAGDHQAYRIYFTSMSGMQDFPVEECQGRAATRTGPHVSFLQWHMKDTVIIVEEGNPPLSQCPHCNMLVPWEALNKCHPNFAQCSR